MYFKHLLVICSCPDDAVAARLAHCLVEERLAACVNRTAAVRSTYLWEGQRQEEPEVLLLVKTAVDRLQEVELRLRALHPYELPEIIALPIVGGSERYLDWLDAGSHPQSVTTAAHGNPATPAVDTPPRESPT